MEGMKRPNNALRLLLSLCLLICLTALSLAQSISPGYSASELISRNDTDIIVLKSYYTYTPIKSVPSLTFDAGAFTGYSTRYANAVAGLDLTANYWLTKNVAFTIGIGDKLDISRQFTLDELSPKNAGLILGGTYRF